MASTSSARSRALASIPISLHCWQGDDVGGFEQSGDRSSAAGWRRPATIPARPARPTSCGPTPKRRLSLIPGRHRFNLHAFYGEFGGRRVDRDEIGPEHFAGWIDWAKRLGIGLDFNPTFFSHPNAADGFTLSHADDGDPRVLDRARHRLPADRRGDRQGARHAVRHQRLDSRRHEGHARRPRAARASGWSTSLDAIFAEHDRPGATTSTRSRASCSASAARATSSARTSSTTATRCRAASC